MSNQVHWLHRLPFALAAVLLLAGSDIARAAAPTLRILILSGQNNHAWRETTPKLRSILESTGRFTVEVTDHPEQCDAATFSHYDALLSNWNTFSVGTPEVTNWPTATRQAFVEFVRSGKGYVSVHAGSSSFYDWPEYQQVAGGASWKLGTTGHGPVHKFEVKIVDPSDPITRGMTNFITTDELWHRTGLQPGVRVLATAFSALDRRGSGQDEPMAVTTTFGHGRSFILLLGHNVRAMTSPGFQALLRRGTEWAASGKLIEPAPRLPGPGLSLAR